MVVRRGARWNRGAPAGAAGEVTGARRAVAVARGCSAQPLRPRALQRIGAVEVVGGDRAAERVVGRAGFTVLGRDQHDALAGARTVDGRRGRTLEDLDRLDVVGVDV